MSKGKPALLLAGVLVAGVLTALGVIFFKSQKEPLVSLPQIQKGPASSTLKAEETYTDEAGFSFGHPKDIKVSDITPNDNLYYTKLSLKKRDKEIIISTKDTKYKTPDEWLTKDKDVPEDTSLVGATSLGGISAKQYTSDGKLWTVAIDQGILYLIEGPKDKGYWEDLHELVVSTFSLSKPGQATGAAGAGDNAIYEEEEVVE